MSACKTSGIEERSTDILVDNSDIEMSAPELEDEASSEVEEQIVLNVDASIEPDSPYLSEEDELVLEKELTEKYNNIAVEEIEDADIIEEDTEVLDNSGDEIESNNETSLIEQVEIENTEIFEEEQYNSEEAVNEIEETHEEVSNPKYYDDYDYPGYIGRLIIPCANIDVALYWDSNVSTSGMQYICDREDSANYFKGYEYGVIIGDHNYQDFKSLGDAYIGCEAYIKYADGTEESWICSNKFNGLHVNDSYGVGIVDYNYNEVCLGQELTLYTCRSSATDIMIVQFSKSE